jgi:hypothetical protein
MRLKLISCEIFYREMCAVVAQSKNQVDIAFSPKGLHDIGREKMLARVQDAVDAVDATQYEAVLLGYALCNNGIAGLVARSIPIVIPRAHDCITLFLGSRERYLEYFNDNPGTYFQTTGWMERGTAAGELKQLSISHQMGIDLSYEELVAKYGEEDAKYIWDTMGNPLRNYGQYTFIEMGIEPDDRFERGARAKAEERGWKFDKVKGDMSLFRQLVDGQWAERDFLVVRPGWRVVARLDEGIIDAEPPS